jgi:hypothetical protein
MERTHYRSLEYSRRFSAVTPVLIMEISFSMPYFLSCNAKLAIRTTLKNTRRTPIVDRSLSRIDIVLNAVLFKSDAFKIAAALAFQQYSSLRYTHLMSLP